MAIAGVGEIERAGLLAWPGLDVEHDGSWIRRAANGHTKRANSAQSLDPADDRNAAARLTTSRRWFEVRGLEPVFRVTPLAGHGVVAALEAAGWRAFDHSHVMAMELPAAVPAPQVEAATPTSAAFLDAQQMLQGYDPATLDKLKALVGVFEVPAMGFIARAEDGRPLASALMAVANGIVITGNVITAGSERRRGHAGAVVRTGFAWAATEGARVASLNVQADNGAGRAFYGSLGYERQYGYCYYRPGRS
ncbi:MAG TPA: GNAT family N-acetyltransferase [Devosiaceae bacterium]|nr:GNAT family N-acetyltransferase [Devosiaceae bacterium]